MKKSLLFLILIFTLSIYSHAQHGIFNINITAGEYVEVPDNTDGLLDINDGFTVEAWILTGSAQSNQKVAGKIGGDFINGFILGIQDGQVNMEVFDDTNTQTVLQTGFVPDTTWTHIAGTYEVGGMLSIYVNGVNVGETAASSGLHSFNPNPFRIGIAPWDVNALGFFGYIDEVRYWNSVLDESTIRDWMHKDLGSDHPEIVNLALYHKYDEGVDDATNDSSGNSNNGVLIGTWLPSTVPFKGIFDLYENDVRGVWQGQSEASSDNLTIIGESLEGDQTIVFAHSNDGNDISTNTPGPNVKRLSKIWRVTTQGMLAASLETQFDLSDVDLSDVDFSEFSLLISDEPDFAGATEIPVELSNYDGTVVTIPAQEFFLDGLYYTLGFVAEGVAVEELFDAKNDFTISPNPGNGIFQMTINSKEASRLSLSMMDITGKTLFQKVIQTGEGTYTESFDISDLSKGMYLLKLNDNKKSSIRKIVVE